MRHFWMITSAALLAFSAQAMAGNSSDSAKGGKAGQAHARLLDASGKTVGTARVWDMGDGIHVEANLTGLKAAGTHGIHLHMVGQCTAPDFTSAGGHWNPMGMMHGSENPQGAHKGDLPNITVDAKGAAKLSAHISGVTLREGPNALLDADGAAIVVHAAADDYRTDPSGNSGARIACGVFMPK